MTKATLKRTTFNWVWFTGSEVQSIVIKVGAGQAGQVQAGVVQELRVLLLYLEASSKILTSKQLGQGS